MMSLPAESIHERPQDLLPIRAIESVVPIAVSVLRSLRLRVRSRESTEVMAEILTPSGMSVVAVEHLRLHDARTG